MMTMMLEIDELIDIICPFLSSTESRLPDAEVGDALACLAGKVPSSASAYLELLGALPSLHAASLKLLRVWLRAGGSALTSCFASVSRLLVSLLAQCSVKSHGSQTAWQVKEEVGLFIPYAGI